MLKLDLSIVTNTTVSRLIYKYVTFIKLLICLNQKQPPGKSNTSSFEVAPYKPSGILAREIIFYGFRIVGKRQKVDREREDNQLMLDTKNEQE